LVRIASAFNRWQSGGEVSKSLSLPVRGEIVDSDRLTVHVSQVTERLKERLKSGRFQRARIKGKKTKSRDLFGLLRARCCKRPYECGTATKRDELAPPHLASKQDNTSYRVKITLGMGRPMSALGQKQTLPRVGTMSALPPRADIQHRYCDVRFVP
jgi:hypothetical protein